MTYNGHFWAEKVLETVHTMGKQHTNAVLLSLGDAKSIKPYQRYPDSAFYFSNDLWRAYYHSHGSTGDEAHEHGHFHFFARQTENDDWSHVVAIGMNNLGQPISLFTTNLWVTDGQWLDTQVAVRVFEQLETSADEDLPLCWFKYMLLLYREEIFELLFQRDQEFANLFPHDRDQGFLDRSVYYLSMMDIDLNSQLFHMLAMSSDNIAAS